MTVRIGVIGAGFAGGTHARACLGIEGVTVTAVATDPVEHGRQLAEECGARLEASAAALCAADDLDVVVVASPTYLHAEHAIAAARGGKHVFCEKPIARTLEEGRAIVEACERACVQLAVGQVVRFFPEYRKAKELIDSGALGKPALATMTRGTFPVGNARPWYLDAAQSGRVVLDLMLHDLDTLRWWFGEPARVYGRMLGGPGGIDYALATIRYADGPIVHLESSWAEHSGFRTTFEVRGDAGLVTHDSRSVVPLQAQFPDSATGPAVIPAPTLLETPYRQQLREFFRRIEAGEEPFVSGREALRSLGLALAVVRATETREVVDWVPPA